MKVSICMITYGHQNYIEKAIHSILNQKTNFDIELIVANDNSPDSTSKIVKNIISSHPNGNKIVFIDNPSNIGIMPNFAQALKRCEGKYVALCEGDDYWIDENKLQKQVDFLENNNDYVICYHKVKMEKEGEIIDDTITIDTPEKTTIYDLAKGNFMHTCSVVYRNHLFTDFPDYFYSSPIGDYFLHLLNARFGNIHYIDQTMAIYRVHNTSYWSSKEQIEREQIWVDFIQNIKGNFDSKVQKLLVRQNYNFQYWRANKFQKFILKLKSKLKLI